MARQTLPVTKIQPGGIADAAGIAAHIDGHAFDNNGTTFLEITTSAGASRTLTIQTPGTHGDRQIEEYTLTVPASSVNRKYGPWATELVNRPSSAADPGKVYLDFIAGEVAGITSVKAYTT